MRKPTICIGENKGADQLRSNCEADHAFVFATRIVQFLYFLILNPQFPASIHSSVCVRPGRCGRNPNCWFSHAQSQLQMLGEART